MTLRSSLAVGILLLGTVAWASVGHAAEPAPQRWALITSPELRTTGLADLLFVEMLKLDGVELVERDELARLTRELELSAVLGPQSVKQRLQLGRMLNADRLMLLSAGADEDGGKGSARNVVIVDTRTGARLLAERLTTGGAPAEETCAALVELARQVRSKYAGGVTAVIGVPYFVSDSLEHHYDHLQREYADLLGHALLNGPGLAVASIEETREIQREMDLAGENVRRMVPLFVRAAYKVPSTAAGEAPRMQIEITLSDGAKPLETIRRDAIPVAEVPGLLTGPVVEAIMRLVGNRDYAPLSPEQQEAALAERADRFWELGAAELALRLRQSVLLLNPDSSRQRMALLVDLASDAGKPDRRRAFPHVEYLFRHRQVNAAQAGELLRMAVAWPLKGKTWRVVNGRPEEIIDPEVPPYIVDPYLGLLRLAPPMFSLPPARSPAGAAISLPKSASLDGAPYSPTARGAQYTLLMELIEGPLLLAPEKHRGRILDDFQALLEAMPEGQLFYFSSGSLGRWERFSDEEMAGFFRSLRESDDPRLAFFADYLQLGLLLKGHPELVDESTPQKVAAMRAALNGLRRWPKGSPGGYVAHRYALNLDQVDSEIVKILKWHARPQEKRHRPLANPIRHAAEPPIEIEAELAIEQIPGWPYPAERLASFSVRDVRLEQLDEKRDVAWDQESIHVLTARQRAAPELRCIYETRPKHITTSNQILRVRSDGRNLWVASAADGVFLLAPDGTPLAVFNRFNGLPPWRTRDAEILVFRNTSAGLASFPRGEQRIELEEGAVNTGKARLDHVELRPSDRFANLLNVISPSRALVGPRQRAMLSVYPVGPGKCLAVGRFDPRMRTWIALLTYDETTQKAGVKVVHTAARMLAPDAYKDPRLLAAPGSIDVIFNVPWIGLYEGPDDSGDRVVLVGRSHDAWAGHTIENTPLAIDLKTEKVTTLAERLPQFGRLRGGSAAVGVRGSLVVANRGILEVFLRQPDGRYAYRQVTPKRTQNHYLIRLGPCVYSPGLSWYKIDLAAPEISKIAGPVDPPQHMLRHFAPSANYGVWAMPVVAGNPCRIDFDSSTRTTISPFRYVPSEHAESHDKAAAAIRALGGYVDHSGRCPCDNVMIMSGKRSGWSTVVCLTDQWRGGDEALALLDDLYNLTTVYLLGAPVSDLGMQHLGRIEELGELYLVETGVTTEGIKQLDATRLHTLHLEDRVGGTSFGDDTLRVLAGNRRIKRLCLYGPRFTDAALESFKAMRQLAILRLLDTAISQETIDRIHPQRQDDGWLRIHLK